jgi:predicted alpha/beta hydrolase
MTEQEPNEPAPADFQFEARDGYTLAATLFRAHASDTVVLINSATAVPRHFYQRFAAFIQSRGWSAVTYDYRGIGDSRPASLRGFDAKMRDWAFLDMTAMVDWVGRELSPARLFAIGHSFGGQTLGMIENAGSIDAMVGVSAQSGYWGVQGGREPPKVRFIVTAVIPVLSHLVGSGHAGAAIRTTCSTTRRCHSTTTRRSLLRCSLTASMTMSGVPAAPWTT